MPKIEIRKSKPDIVNKFTGGKWAYSKIVKSHFFHPRNFLAKEPKKGEFDAEGIVGSPACVLPSTLVQKSSTLEPIARVHVGDSVLSHDGHFHDIQRIFNPSCNTTLIQLKNQLGEIIATVDHLIFAMPIPRKINSPFVHTKNKKKIPPSWIHARDLKKGDVVLYPISKTIREISDIPLLLSTRKRYDFRSRPLPPRLQLNEETLELFGYFLSEGHIKHDSSEVGFTFGYQEMKYVERVTYLIKRHFGLSSSFRRRPQNNRIDVAVYNVHLANLFRNWFGYSATTKRIPEFILFLHQDIQRGIIRGLWRGDGYLSTERLQPRAGFKTISETLMHQIVWLLLRQKIIPSVYQEKAYKKADVSRQKSYQIHVGDMTSLERLAAILEISFERDSKKYHVAESWFDDNYLYIPIREISEIEFEGRLLNFEVAESHTYATDAFLVHNCGDVMRIWLKINPKTERIKAFKWRTFGCASAIAATSMLSVMATEKGGMKLDKALKIKPQDIMKRLGGLPDRKIHCSVLGDKALRTAINNWFKKTGQYERIIVEGSRILDPNTKTTEADIEEAVIDGATTLEAVQKRTKVGIGYPKCIPEAEELIRFYREKYFGKDGGKDGR